MSRVLGSRVLSDKLFRPAFSHQQRRGRLAVASPEILSLERRVTALSGRVAKIEAQNRLLTRKVEQIQSTTGLLEKLGTGFLFGVTAGVFVARYLVLGAGVYEMSQNNEENSS